MSQGNAEIVASAIDALNTRDKELVDSLCDDAVEWQPALTPGGGVEDSVYSGKAGIVRYLEDVERLFNEMEMEVERIESVAEDHALYRGRVSGETVEDLPLDVPVWGFWQLRDGKLFRGRAFLSEDEAVESLRQSTERF